jgi:GT2 family glycosyltransferase
MQVNKVDLIILNYNGAEILPLCLPSIVEAAKRSPVPCQVIILDNKSKDKSIDYVRRNFPDVRIEITRENRVLFSYNELIPKLDSDIIILLNNDIKVDPDFIAPLLEYFKDKDIFGVAPRQMHFDGKGYNGGLSRIEFRCGMISATQKPFPEGDARYSKASFTLFNANGAFDRKKFLELGGFDDIFFPATWEDTDLCYRAWKKGWKMMYEPSSVIYHFEHYTMTRDEKNKDTLLKDKRAMNRRNMFVFTWKDISDPAILSVHFLLLPFNLLSATLYDRAKIRGFFEAVKVLPRIMKAKMDQNRSAKVEDKEILKLI